MVVDVYLAIRSVLADLPEEVPDDFLGIPVSAHWRLLQRLEILDPRPYLEEAARIAARFRRTGWLIAENAHRWASLWPTTLFGAERNAGVRLAEIATDLGIEIHITIQY